MSNAGLYPDTEGDSRVRCGAFIQSCRLNKQAYLHVDQIKRRCVNFVHGDQWDPDVEQDRADAGLPSLVLDKTQSVYKILDGWARKNKHDVQFNALGKDDPEKAQLYNTLFVSIREGKGLGSKLSEAYGLAAITDEAYLHVFAKQNLMGEMEPAFELLQFDECYPDFNCREPINLEDAEFIDCPRFMTVPAMKRVYRRFMSPEFAALIKGYKAPWDTKNPRRLKTLADDTDFGSGTLRVITRYYKLYRSKKTLVDLSDGSSRPFDGAEAETLTPSMIKTMGFRLQEEDEEIIMRAVMVPAISENTFLMDAQNDFQPLNVNVRGGKHWPICREVHQWIAGRPCGAIRTVLKLQESRNIIFSALQHHIQTAANGGLLAERNAIKDPVEREKFENRRNRASITIWAEDDALKEQRIQPIPKGNMAFGDAGSMFEEALSSAMREITGAEPVLRGEAQPGSPASLFSQQTEASATQLIGSQDLARDFEFHCAELTACFIRQFYTSERAEKIIGEDGNPKTILLNQATARGVLNDLSQGLFTVQKSQSVSTPTARRARLNDNIQILKLMQSLGMPSPLLDFESLLEDMDIPMDRKNLYLQQLAAWKQMQGFGSAPAQPGGAPDNRQPPASTPGGPVSGRLPQPGAQPGPMAAPQRPVLQPTPVQ